MLIFLPRLVFYKELLLFYATIGIKTTPLMKSKQFLKDCTKNSKSTL